VKKRGGVYPVDTVVLPGAAIDAIRGLPAVPATGPVVHDGDGPAVLEGEPPVPLGACPGRVPGDGHGGAVA
jgi:hypothetical protein